MLKNCLIILRSDRFYRLPLDQGSCDQDTAGGEVLVFKLSDHDLNSASCQRIHIDSVGRDPGSAHLSINEIVESDNRNILGNAIAGP